MPSNRHALLFGVLLLLGSVSARAAPFFEPANWLVGGGGIAVTKIANNPDSLTFRLRAIPVNINEGRAIDIESALFGDFEFDYTLSYGGLPDATEGDPEIAFFDYLADELLTPLRVVVNEPAQLAFYPGQGTTSGRLSARRSVQRPPSFNFVGIGQASSFGAELTISAIPRPPPPPSDVPAPPVTMAGALLLAACASRRAARGRRIASPP